MQVKVGEGVNRHTGLLARCFGKPAAESASAAGKRGRGLDAARKPASARSGSRLAEPDQDDVSVSSVDCNQGIEVFEVEIRRGDTDHHRRLPPTESAL